MQAIRVFDSHHGRMVNMIVEDAREYPAVAELRSGSMESLLFWLLKNFPNDPIWIPERRHSDFTGIIGPVKYIDTVPGLS